MSGPAQNGRVNSEPGIVLFILFGLIFALLWFIWTYFKVQILEAMRWTRYCEFFIISFFTDNGDACLNWLKNVHFEDPSPSPKIVEWTRGCFGNIYLARLPAEQEIEYFQLSAPGMAAIERLITYYDRWFVVFFLGSVGVYHGFFSPRTKFRTRHTLESFIRVQSKMWPVISPIVNFNPAKASARRLGDTVPDKLPPFAEALSPEEWVAWHRIAVTNGIPDREATRRAFLLQLGPRWTGVDSTPPHIRALFAAFAMKGAQQRDDSDSLLNRLSTSWTMGGGLRIPGDVMSDIKKVLADPKTFDPAIEVANQHAYRVTAVLGVLRWARQNGGVLAPAQFLWLRAVDRALWYPLNNLGRRSFHTEGAGAMAHFMAERNAKKPLPIPRIDTAIVTLNQYFATSGLPVPPREGDNGKKRT